LRQPRRLRRPSAHGRQYARTGYLLSAGSSAWRPRVRQPVRGSARPPWPGRGSRSMSSSRRCAGSETRCRRVGDRRSAAGSVHGEDDICRYRTTTALAVEGASNQRLVWPPASVGAAWPRADSRPVVAHPVWGSLLRGLASRRAAENAHASIHKADGVPVTAIYAWCAGNSPDSVSAAHAAICGNPQRTTRPRQLRRPLSRIDV